MKRVILFVGSCMFLLNACGGADSPGTAEQGTEPDLPRMSRGQKLFSDNCAICHSVKIDKMGPALEGFMERWDHDTARVIAFIRNSDEVIRSGDLYAGALYRKWNKATMTPFPKLTDGDIKELIRYIREEEAQ